jgi:superkiller protein 3
LRVVLKFNRSRGIVVSFVGRAFVHAPTPVLFLNPEHPSLRALNAPLVYSIMEREMRRSLFILVAFAGLALWAQSNAAIQQLEASARSHLAARDAVSAVADYEKLAQLVPQSADYQDEIGFLLAAMNRAREAVPHFERATQLNPKLARAWFHLGVARLILQQPSGIAALEKAVALEPANPDYHFRLGTAYNDAARYGEAIVQLRLAAKGMPAKSAVWALLARALEQRGEFKQARDAYGEAVTLDPGNTVLRNSYGYMLVKCGNPTAGLVQFKKILEREPDNVHVLVNVGYAYIGAGDYKQAIRCLSQVVKNHPQAGDAHYDLGVAYKQSDDLQHARTELEQAIKFAPAIVEAHYMLALTCVDLGDTSEAVAQLRAAVQQRPNYSDAWFELGMVLKDQGDIAGAIQALQRSVELDATDAGAFNTLGLLLKRKGDAEGSKQAFAKAAALRQAEADEKRRKLEQGTAKPSQ